METRIGTRNHSPTNSLRLARRLPNRGRRYLPGRSINQGLGRAVPARRKRSNNHQRFFQSRLCREQWDRVWTVAGRRKRLALVFCSACDQLRRSPSSIYFLRTPRNDDRVLGACALLLAGIVGNLTDRARLGYVVDFIDFHVRTYHWPTFNIADASITIGAILLAYDLVFARKERAVDCQ